MSRQVWKYEVPIDDQWHELRIPRDFRVLHVGQQTDPHRVCFWVDVRDDHLKVGRRFCVFGTGHNVPPGAVHRGTVQDHQHGLVWHLFEESLS
jgi:hypothetical protein